MNCAHCEDRIVRLPRECTGCTGKRGDGNASPVLFHLHRTAQRCERRHVLGQESPGSVAGSMASHPDHREHATRCSRYLEGLGSDCLEESCRAAVCAGHADVNAHAGLDGQPRGDLCWRRCDGPSSIRDLLPDGRAGQTAFMGMRFGVTTALLSSTRSSVRSTAVSSSLGRTPNELCVPRRG